MELKGGHGDPKKNCREPHADTHHRYSHSTASRCTCAKRGEALHEETGRLSASGELQTSATASSEGNVAAICAGGSS